MSWFDVDFGAASAGLGTVGYRQYNNTGGDAVARTTVGVVEIGDGAYGVEVTPDAAAEGIQWDTGGGSPIFANEAISGSGITPALETVINTTLDILEGDHQESSTKIQIFKKGTATKILDKDVGGSLLTPGVTITTNEP